MTHGVPFVSHDAARSAPIYIGARGGVLFECREEDWFASKLGRGMSDFHKHVGPYTDVDRSNEQAVEGDPLVVIRTVSPFTGASSLGPVRSLSEMIKLNVDTVPDLRVGTVWRNNEGFTYSLELANGVDK